MSRLLLLPIAQKLVRVGIDRCTSCCGPFPLAWDAGPALCLQEDCFQEVAPAGCLLLSPWGPPTSTWTCNWPCCDPLSRNSRNCRAASNRQREPSTTVRRAQFQLFSPPWHCPLARKHLSHETDRGGAHRPTRHWPKPPPYSSLSKIVVAL